MVFISRKHYPDFSLPTGRYRLYSVLQQVGKDAVQMFPVSHHDCPGDFTAFQCDGCIIGMAEHGKSGVQLGQDVYLGRFCHRHLCE